MARTVDEEAKTARLREIANAVSRVMARQGAGLASLRDIADEMGSSVGVLTHYFENKEELYLYSWRHLVGELFAEALATSGGEPGLSRLERILNSALPTTPDRWERWRQWMAFLGAAVSGGVILDEERKSNERFLRALVLELAAAVEAGDLPADLSVEGEARALMSLVDGLGVDAVLHPELFGPKDQEFVVRRHLARLGRPD
jgi:AcrR family transcriptional regulator